MCRIWFHNGCQKVSQELYKHIEVLEVAKINIEWFSKNCKGEFRTLNRTNNALKAQTLELKQQNEWLVKRLDDLEKKFERLKKDVSNEVIEETKEKEEKKEKTNNMIIYNMKEKNQKGMREEKKIMRGKCVRNWWRS